MNGYEKSARFYDLFDEKQSVGFFGRYAAQAGRILDVGAGTGRIGIPLARQGIHVVCVEPSPAMRRQLLEKLRTCPHVRDRIELLPDDAASFHLDRTFPVACLSGTFDHFLDHEERLASLKNVVHHLEPGGTLVFDVFVGLMTSSPLASAGRCQRGDRQYHRFVGREALPGERIRVDLVYEAYHSGELVDRIEEASTVGITSREEIHGLLAEVGCRLLHEFSDYDSTPFREGDDLLIVEAAYRL